MGMIGGAAVGIIALVGVAGYFAMARVDSVKSETALANTSAQQATSQTAAIHSQVASLGKPVVDSDKQLAQGAEQVLVAAYTERHDFVGLSNELRGIMEGTGGWYDSVKASTAGGAGADAGTTKSVTIVGYMPTKELAASFNERVEGTRALKNADVSSLESAHLRDLSTRRAGVYYKFTITADFVDTIAPSADGDAGGTGGTSATGTTVGSSTGGDLSLSLDPEPAATKPKAAKPKATKPANPFDIAASAAGRGGAA
jgi:hypothetical protein